VPDHPAHSNKKTKTNPKRILKIKIKRCIITLLTKGSDITRKTVERSSLAQSDLKTSSSIGVEFW